MSGVRSQCETIAAMLLRGHDPTPIAAGPPPLVSSAPDVGVHYNAAPWRGPVGMVPIGLDLCRHHAFHTLADTIARASGMPLVAILAMLDTMPGSYITLLDDHFGWMILGDMIAHDLGILDPDHPLVPYPTN